MPSGAHRAGSVGRYLSGLSMQDETKVSQRLFVRATIECRVETAWGDTVVVCGSSEQLGSWRPARALRMATDEALYPIWRCEPLLLCSDDVEFKFVVVRADGAEGPDGGPPLASATVSASSSSGGSVIGRDATP